MFNIVTSLLISILLFFKYKTVANRVITKLGEIVHLPLEAN